MRYQIFLRPEPEGGFTVFVPALPGCITWGKDLDHARRMAADAIRAYLASLRKHGEPVPEDRDGLLTTVEVRAAGCSQSSSRLGVRLVQRGASSSGVPGRFRSGRGAT